MGAGLCWLLKVGIPPILAARDLPIEDQISLLKGATFELCQLRFNTVFNPETGTWECGRLSYCLEDPAGVREPPACPGGGREAHLGREEEPCVSQGVHVLGQTLMREVQALVYFLTSLPLLLHSCTGGFQQLLLEPVLKFHYMLKKLQLHEEEYVLMQAISLFSPGEDPPAAWPPPSPGLLTAPLL